MSSLLWFVGCRARRFCCAVWVDRFHLEPKTAVRDSPLGVEFRRRLKDHPSRNPWVELTGRRSCLSLIPQEEPSRYRLRMVAFVSDCGE